MKTFVFDNAAESIPVLTTALLRHGAVVEPRGLRTRELRNVTIQLNDPGDCLMQNVGRNMNYKLAALESLQLIGGFSDPHLMGVVAPATKRFMTGGHFHGAYGPRIAPQMPKILERLKKDPDTRQGVVNIWDPAQDLFLDGSPDYPCTVGFNFAIRNNRLLMSTHMRSNDLWWGWTYDVVQFTQLQWTVANILGMDPGPYTHYVDSFHMYEKDIFDAKQIIPATGSRRRLRGLAAWGWQWSTAADVALGLTYQQTHPKFTYTETERWMEEQINGKLAH